jgi:hypothetical protein
VTPAAYPRVLLCDGLRHRRGSAPAFANALIEPGRLSPPIWPCTTRGFPCSRYYYRDGGLLPHLFTLAQRTSFSKTSRRFPCAMPPCCSAGGIFSVALSVTEPHRVELSSTPPAEASNSTLRRSLRGRPLALPGALPYFVTGSCEPTTTVSGLSSRPDCSEPAITRPVRQSHYSPNFLAFVSSTTDGQDVSCPCMQKREALASAPFDKHKGMTALEVLSTRWPTMLIARAGGSA